MSKKGNATITSADGKLDLLIPGIGAASTTFMAGIEAVLEVSRLERVGVPFQAIPPMKAVFDPKNVRRIHGPNVRDRGSKMKNRLRWMRGEDLITHLGLEYYD